MLRNRKTPIPPEIAELLAASEGLYHAARAEIRAGRALPDDAESPSRIAFTTAMFALRERIECPTWARDCVLHDWARFERFECASIGEAFNIPDTRHAHAKRAARLAAAVYHSVRELEGIPQKDNAKRKGSLSIVGEKFHMSAAQVKQRMGEWRMLCRATGTDPDARMKLAAPGPLIARTIVAALTPAPRVKKKKKV